MKEVEFKNFSLKGITNAILMRRKNYFKTKVLGKTFHHGYVGLILLVIGMTFGITIIDFAGLLIIIHDSITHVLKFFHE